MTIIKEGKDLEATTLHHLPVDVFYLTDIFIRFY